MDDSIKHCTTSNSDQNQPEKQDFVSKNLKNDKQDLNNEDGIIGSDLKLSENNQNSDNDELKSLEFVKNMDTTSSETAVSFTNTISDTDDVNMMKHNDITQLSKNGDGDDLHILHMSYSQDTCQSITVQGTDEKIVPEFSNQSDGLLVTNQDHNINEQHSQNSNEVNLNNLKQAESNDNLSLSDSDDSSQEKSDKLNQEMQNLMHKNLENFSPKKEPKAIINDDSVQLLKSSNSVSSERPHRVNPFNDNSDSITEVQPDVWQMHHSHHPNKSESLQTLSSNDFQIHIGSDHNSPLHQEEVQNEMIVHDSTNSQFDLMPPSYRGRPVGETICDEDIDVVVKEVKLKSPPEKISDPWVKMDSHEKTAASNHVSDSSTNAKKQVKAKPNETKSLSSASFVRPLIEAAGPCDPADLIDGIIFTAYYLGSTQLQSEKNPGKNARMMQAQEAVGRIKAPEGESQPSVEVDLFISTDKVKVLNADSQETMMDHTLRSISYIADIGKLLVIMAKRRSPSNENQKEEQVIRDPKPQRSYRVICHVFSSPDAQLMAQAIGQSFNVAYQQFLSANGIEPQTLTRDDFNQLLDMQEMYHDDLVHYSKRENVKDIWVEKNKGELLGVVIVESGWGSIVPTVILANLQHGGPAERCGKLSIGDQIMTINGTSLVGLPLTTCQSIVKGLRSQTIARLHIVSCPPVVTVLIKRPDLKYQLGFSVQDGIICSLMRGGIAERGGVRVGHRIIEINNQSVVATPHEKIVQTLVSSVGEIQMKTMPAMMYRLLTGQEQPVYI